MSTGPLYKSSTAGGLAAEDEERWFDELAEAVEEYVHLYAQYIAAPKSEREDLNAQVHEAKRTVIERFYAQGWDK